MMMVAWQWAYEDAVEGQREPALGKLCVTSLLNAGDCCCGIACSHYLQDCPVPSFLFPNSIKESLICPGLCNESHN